MHSTITPLTPAVLEIADAIQMEAFGKHESRRDDIRRLLELQPDGYFLAWSDDQPVGMGGAVDYGPFAYVGMVGVRPAYQRRGIARCLMAHILDWLRSRGTPAAWLDASPLGFPLYQKLGFADIEDAAVYVQPEPALVPPPPDFVRPLQPADLTELLAFDPPVFGADRSRLLRLLVQDFPGCTFVARDPHGRLSGYLVARGRRFGPWVASDPQAAEGLLQAALLQPLDGPAALVSPAANRLAPDLLQRCGFLRLSALRHMRLGHAPTTMRREWVYAQTSFALG